MDPNLFHLDWERTFEALVAIMVLAFFVERACALLFESRWYIRLFEDPRVAKPTIPIPDPDDPHAAEVPPPPPPPKDMPGRMYPVKELIAFGLAAVVCVVWQFDAVSMILLREKTSIVGSLITAAVIAGGSKASIALFHSIMNIRSSADQERQKLKQADRA